jgi:hypothetical protein
VTAEAPEAELLAQSMAKQLSSDILQALAPARVQIQQLRQLSPTLTERMQPLFASIERAHDIAQSARLFSDARDLAPASEALDAAHFMRASIQGRSDWLHERGIRVRQALSMARVQARPGELYTFIDELLLWTSDFSTDIALQLEAVHGDEARPRTRLRVGAWFDGSAHDGHNPRWQNTRWFVWHRIARRLGARTELRTADDHLVLRVSFPPVDETATQAHHEADLPTGHEQLHGIRVLVISAHADRRAAVLDALVPLGVRCDVAVSVASAQATLQGAALDAVIHDEMQTPEDMQALRSAPAITPATACVELHAGGTTRDFQASTVGAFTTGHVAADAIARTLVPALNFELFKGIGKS